MNLPGVIPSEVAAGVHFNYKVEAMSDPPPPRDEHQKAVDR